MNYKELLKHIKNTTYADIVKRLAPDGSNAREFFCADVVGGRKFALNYGGYPRSEIAEINEATNVHEQAYLLSQLKDYSPSTNPNAGKTDAEIMLGHKSKYLQSASEMQSYIESQIAIRDARAAAAAAASSQKPNDGTIKFDSDDNPTE